MHAQVPTERNDQNVKPSKQSDLSSHRYTRGLTLMSWVETSVMSQTVVITDGFDWLIVFDESYLTDTFDLIFMKRAWLICWLIYWLFTTVMFVIKGRGWCWYIGSPTFPISLKCRICCTRVEPYSAVPDGTVPNGTVPSGTVPDGTVTNGTVQYRRLHRSAFIAYYIINKSRFRFCTAYD